MYDNKIKKAFENVKPSKELVQRVLAAESIAVHSKSKPAPSFLSRHIFVIAAAICTVLICAVIAAAMTGLIDFDTIFGNYIAVKDSELANSLIGTVSHFKYKVSDSDYKIDVKGVTGTEREMIAVVEISRKDGEPTIKHLANPTDEIHLLYLWQEDNANQLLGGSSGIDFYINDAGNIELYMEFGSERKMDGKTVTVRGENFYPKKAYKDFKDANGIDYLHQKDFSGYVKVDEIDGGNPPVPTKIDDSGVIALALEWEFSFQYKSSPEALKTKDSFEPDKGFPYYQDVYALIQKEYGSYSKDESTYTVQENPADSVQIKIGPLGGKIQFSYPLNEYERACFGHPMAYSIDGRKGNQMLLIMVDGLKIPIKINSESKSNDGGPLYQCSCSLFYLDEQGRKKVIDIDSVTAISINGVEYGLK